MPDTEWRSASGRMLKLVAGDITRVPADAIVNAANSALAGGGGVDGAIHRAGGPSIMAELDAIRAKAGGCPTGSAVATGAGKLPAKYVFHAVGPVYRDGRHGEPELLESCYRTCLDLAERHGARSITFPGHQRRRVRISHRRGRRHRPSPGYGPSQPARYNGRAGRLRAVRQARLRRFFARISGSRRCFVTIKLSRPCFDLKRPENRTANAWSPP